MLDINKIRKQFPILNRRVNGEKLTYLDNGATSQKPQSVIDTINNLVIKGRLTWVDPMMPTPLKNRINEINAELTMKEKKLKGMIMEESMRIENRISGSDTNPYLAAVYNVFALVIGNNQPAGSSIALPK